MATQVGEREHKRLFSSLPNITYPGATSTGLDPLPREAIQRPDQHHIKLSFTGIFKEPSKAGAFPLSFCPALVAHVLIMDHVALASAELTKLGELVLDALPPG